MRTLRLLALILCGTLILLGTAGVASAASVTTHAEYTITPPYEPDPEDPSPPLPPPPMTDTDDDTGTSGTIHSEVFAADPWDPSWAIAEAKAAGNVDGKGAATAHYMDAYGNEVWAAAGVAWSNTYTVSSAGAYTWDFFVENGELSIEDYCYGPSMIAGYYLDIFFDSALIWTSEAYLDGGQAGYTYDVIGTDIGGTFFDYGSYFGYTFDRYDESLDLGTFAAGDSFEISYELMVGVFGPGYETGAYASIGDPGDLSGGGLYGTLEGGGDATVPIPGAVWLLGSGLMGLAGFRRKFRG